MALFSLNILLNSPNKTSRIEFYQLNNQHNCPYIDWTRFPQDRINLITALERDVLSKWKKKKDVDASYKKPKFLKH